MGDDKPVDVPEQRIVVGRISAASGLKGELRVRSHTRPETEILEYPEWLLGSDDPSGQARRFKLKSGGQRGKNLVVRLEGVTDRNQAEALAGQTISVLRESLTKTGQGEFYWDDLIGLTVVDVNGVALGKVDHLVETGANDVLVVRPDSGDKSGNDDKGGAAEILVPWIDQVIVEVDLSAGRIQVDWDPDF